MMNSTLPKIGFLATGNELIEGDTLNTNSHNMAHILIDEGFVIGSHIMCSDEETDIEQALHFLILKHDVIIITGGLGPTSDDRTRYALARVLNKPLVFDETIWEYLIKRFQRLALNPTANNKQQALFPEGADILPNQYGSAAGCSINFNDKLVFMLPGPPNECLPMFREFVLPRLTHVKTHQRIKLKWRLLGAIESEMAGLVDAAIIGHPITSGYRIEYPYLEVKLYAEEITYLESVLAAVKEIFLPYLISDTHHTATELLKQALANFQSQTNIVDRATGGYLQTAVQTPENFSYLSFNEQKASSNNEQLFVEITGLGEYWQKQQPNGKTKLHLLFNYRTITENRIVEIPYRNVMIIKYAVEYAAYTILQFMQQHQLIQGFIYENAQRVDSAGS